MTQPADEAAVEFADDNDAPIGYMQRTRGWYLGLGYPGSWHGECLWPGRLRPA